MTAQPITRPIGETQQLILKAAMDCLQQWGIEKTSLNDIAKQAGVTRPTVYRYFASRNEVLSAALLQSAYVLAQRLVEHMNGFEDTAERYLETVLFALAEFPKVPHLMVITRTDLSSYVSADALSNAEGWSLSRKLMQQVFYKEKLSENDLDEITEVTIRMILSLLMMAGPKKRSQAELRAFLARRLLPMLPLKAGS